MRLYRAAWVVVGLLALAAVGLILASIFGVHVILLAAGTVIVTLVAAGGAAQLRIWHDGKLDAEKQRKQELEWQKEGERRKEIDSLDRECRELVERAEKAVRVVIHSDARSRNLLNTDVNKGLLWDKVDHIEMNAKKISDLRTKHRSITASSVIGPERWTAANKTGQEGPMTAAGIGRQRQAIEMALGSVESLVENLEHYAASVKAVDATHRDWVGAQEVERLNDDVLDLLASTVKDELAVEEVRTLAERAAQAKEAFEESVREANLAAETLALPDEIPES
jgi:hypothetical protein